MREARRLAPAPAPLHIVGFSNGGALAMKYALDVLDDAQLARPERIVLFAPMIGITSMARFAGVFGWPAFFPAFDKAAWLGIVPEFNPFRYNSFPVNGARQSSLVARRLQAQIDRHAREDNLKLSAAGADLPVGGGLHRQHTGHRHRAVCQAAGQRQRAGALRPEPQRRFGPLLRAGTDTAVAPAARAAAQFPRSTAGHQRQPAERPGGGCTTEAGAIDRDAASG